MDAKALEKLIASLLFDMTGLDHEDMVAAGLPDSDGMIDRVETFESAGILTTDPGVVVTTSDGSEFQVTIVRSR
jgi:hypothetical protein